MKELVEVKISKIVPFGLWGQLAFLLNLIIIGLFLMPESSPMLILGSIGLKIIIWYAFFFSLAIIPIVIYQTKDEDGLTPTVISIVVVSIYIYSYFFSDTLNLYIWYGILACTLLAFAFMRIKKHEAGDSKSAIIMIGGVVIMAVAVLIGLRYIPPSAATIDPDWGEFDWSNFTTIIIIFIVVATIFLAIELYLRYQRNETIVRPLGKTFKNAFKKDKEPIDFPETWKKRERKF